MTKFQTREEASADLRAAEETLAKLEEQQRASGARMAEIAGEKEQLAHQALTAGGQAKTRLKELNREAAEIALQNEDLASAVRQARRNINRARHEVDAAVKRDNARKVVELAGKLEGAGARAHEHFIAAFTELAKARAITDELRALGAPAPVWFSFMGAFDRALAGYQLSIKPARLIRDFPPPSQRKSLVEIFHENAASARRWADAVTARRPEAA